MQVTAKNLFKLPDGRHPVAPNLILVVRGSSRSFVFRYTLAGKRREKSLGSANKITVSQAKELVEKFRVGLADGAAPITPKESLDKEIKGELTFEDYALETIKKIASVRMWRNAKHKEQWFTTVRAYAFPVLGKKKLSEIKKADILEVLEPLWSTKTETASRVRGRLENIFSYAVADGLMDFNPALWRGNLDRDLPPASKVQPVKHQEAMPLEELQEKIGCLYPANTRTKPLHDTDSQPRGRIRPGALGRDRLGKSYLVRTSGKTKRPKAIPAPCPLK